MAPPRLLRAAFLLAALPGCAPEPAPWPPEPGDVRVTDLTTARSAQTFFDSTWPAIQRVADAHGYEAEDPDWWVDHSYPWRMTPEARVHGHVSASLWFDLVPRHLRAGSPQRIWLEFVRPGHDAPWQPVLRDGFLQARPPRSEDPEAHPDVVGVPALEVAIQRLLPPPVDWLDSPAIPSVPLNSDTASWHSLAAFLEPFDSTMRAAIAEEDLRWRGASPYEWLGVAPVDSVDRVLGLREGVLRLRVTAGPRLAVDSWWFELQFARAGPGAPWALLQLPNEARVPRGRSPFHARVRVVEDRVRRLFTTQTSMQDWWVLREHHRAAGVAPALHVGRLPAPAERRP